MNRVLRWLLPAWAAVRVPLDVPGRDLNQWRALVATSGDELEAISVELFDRDLARIRRLEDKLAAQLGFATPLIPIVSGVGALAIGADHLGSAILAFVAAFHLLLTYLIAHTAHRGIELHMPFAEHVANWLSQGNATGAVGSDLAARRLWSMEQNQPVAIELNNLIWAAERSLQYAVVLLATAGLLAM